ncbi:MAG: cupin domain-containing protein [Clostridia bacterium]|nr:cupin domain-containing protein [Clostridia bacterium]
MKLLKDLTPDFMYSDDRGLLVQLCREGYSQVNAVFTKKGAVRGNFHYHKHTKEAFFILSGKVRVTASRGEETEIRSFETGDMFLVEEYVRHSFEYLEDTCLVGLYTVPVESANGEKDIHTL